jgi:hypothetical protein
MTAFSAWLDGMANSVFALSATLFLVINVGAAAAVFLKRDRAMVNRWTARWLGANLLLVGAGVGVPVAATVVRLAVNAVSATRVLRSVPQEAIEAREFTPAPPRP